MHDPHALQTAAQRHPELEYADTVEEATRGADIVVTGTEWLRFREVDPAVLTGVAAQRIVVDLRNVLDAEWWVGAGWTVHQLGRPSRRPA
ncbi:hypothetical protein M878_28690 [Streptomyces roseochromogenus subsp. oscitans DS 12.976]|uniref:UDP-glucose/GDP-mannose dehydrogenase C-terminal domain-containing protein n=1 Tax=Streptomyces roseochromogenus subsp. oscitans DS 12.976 TaxID=1352936 RepID=V6K097_STRRC|nr:hypothetical protein M878_28690 [Streptomyces roseochromogenus subsp. oscitans DS 12.976]